MTPFIMRAIALAQAKSHMRGDGAPFNSTKAGSHPNSSMRFWQLYTCKASKNRHAAIRAAHAASGQVESTATPAIEAQRAPLCPSGWGRTQEGTGISNTLARCRRLRLARNLHSIPRSTLTFEWRSRAPCRAGVRNRSGAAAAADRRESRVCRFLQVEHLQTTAAPARQRAPHGARVGPRHLRAAAACERARRKAGGAARAVASRRRPWRRYGPHDGAEGAGNMSRLAG
eukprot:360543-Chlamydomonas_euryale.AAC.6